MKISERVALLRAGYNKEEIAAMIEEEKTAAADPPSPVVESAPPVPDEEVVDPVPAPEVETMFPVWARGLIESVNELKNAVEASNRAAIEQPPEVSTTDAAANALITAYEGR